MNCIYLNLCLLFLTLRVAPTLFLKLPVSVLRVAPSLFLKLANSACQVGQLCLASCPSCKYGSPVLRKRDVHPTQERTFILNSLQGISLS
jgi:hypothetical protein